ncbi:MAG: anti-sigma F factor [Gemmiger sp.]
MKAINQVKITFTSRSVNEAFARAALAAFLVQADPTVPQLADIKTAVSEAVTNCIVHAYPDSVGWITLTAVLFENNSVRITVADRGVGISDVAKAMEPLYTTGNPEERAGLGFAVMQSFMDKVRVVSAPGHGTRVTMVKQLESRV